MATHVWELDANGEVEYFELGVPGESFCGGPHCTVCDEYICQHEPDFDWNAECVSAQ